jgi:transcriptional regulator with XRE-family HTH domain
MPRRITSTLNGRALAELRSSLNMSQTELAERAGLTKWAISALEKGRQPLRREELDRLAGLMGCGPDKVEAQLLRLEMEPAAAAAAWVAPSPAALQMIDRAALSGARTALGTLRSGLARNFVANFARQERTVAEELWESLRLHPPGERSARIDEDPVYHSWGLAELLCAASEKAAAADAEQSLALAGLALHTAGYVHESPLWRSRIQGRCWAFVGNARRVAGKLVLADQAFVESERLWEEGKPADPGGILDEGRLLDMKASLRRDQRRPQEALELHQRALKATKPAERGYILVNKSRTHEALKEYEEAIQLLKQASSLLVTGDQRLIFGTWFNLAVNLCRLNRHSEAEQVLPTLELGARLANSLDIVRLHWLKGWIAAGLGRADAAISLLEWVRSEFSTRSIDYDMALASLDLAALYLEKGHAKKVKELAREMAPIFSREQVIPEALNALRIFCEAAAQETATLALVRRLSQYLDRVRYEPSQKFEG